MLRVLAEREAAGVGRQTGEGSKEYTVDHLEFFSKADLPWPPSDDDLAAAGMSRVMKMCQRRVVEALYYMYKIRDPSPTNESVTDANKSLPWQVSSARICVCVCMCVAIHVRACAWMWYACLGI